MVLYSLYLVQEVMVMLQSDMVDYDKEIGQSCVQSFLNKAYINFLVSFPFKLIFLGIILHSINKRNLFDTNHIVTLAES